MRYRERKSEALTVQHTRLALVVLWKSRDGDQTMMNQQRKLYARVVGQGVKGNDDHTCTKSHYGWDISEQWYNTSSRGVDR